MSADPAHEAIVVEVYPAYNEWPPDFTAQVRQALDAEDPTFVYDHVEFSIETNGNKKVRSIRAMLPSVDAPLPPVFGAKLNVNLVAVRCYEVPTDPQIQPGCYMGGDAVCEVDPSGDWNNGRGGVCATGIDFGVVVELFRNVVAGRLTPSRAYGGLALGM